MSDNDRLAGIERLREAAGIPTPMRVVSFPGDEYGGTWELHLEGDTFDVWGRDYAEAYTAEIAVYLAALVNNADWLIAHVRELEARVARDAKVVEAARAYRAAERKVEVAGYASMSIGDRLIRGDLRERLDAALADAEG